MPEEIKQDALAKKDNETFAGVSINMLTTLKESAKLYIASGLAPDHIKKPETAIVIAMKAQELGMSFIQGQENINVIHGKTSLSAAMIQAKIRQSGKCEYLDVIKWDDTTCIMETKRTDEKKPKRYEFGVKEATDMGLIAKDNYKKQKKVMFYNRCMSGIGRYFYADVFLGNIYTPDELRGDKEEAIETASFKIEETPYKDATKSMLAKDPLTSGHTGKMPEKDEEPAGTLTSIVVDVEKDTLGWSQQYSDTILKDVPTHFLHWVAEESPAPEDVKLKAKSAYDMLITAKRNKAKKPEYRKADIQDAKSLPKEEEKPKEEPPKDALFKEDGDLNTEAVIIDMPIEEEATEELDPMKVDWATENALKRKIKAYLETNKQYSDDEASDDQQIDFKNELLLSVFLRTEVDKYKDAVPERAIEAKAMIDELLPIHQKNYNETAKRYKELKGK